MVSAVANARFLNSDEIDEAKNELSASSDSIDVKLGSDVVESTLLGIDEFEEVGNESVCEIGRASCRERV